MKLRLITILLTYQFSLFSQSTPKLWLTKNESDYAYVYHFGESEWESSLMLTYTGGQWYGQIGSGEWSDEGDVRWIWKYENLNNIKITGNKFYSDKTNGEFVTYMNGKEVVKGLKVYQSWSGGENIEIGYQSHPLFKNFSGKFPKASYQLLSKTDLTKLTKRELKIMRNEIYARYGYRFREGGEMAAYFEKQEWYKKEYQNVDHFITDLEKLNIALIQEAERKK